MINRIDFYGMTLSIFGSNYAFLIAILLFVLVQGFVYRIYSKTNKVLLALAPNFALLGLGILLAIIGYFIGLEEIGPWQPILGAWLIFIMMALLTIISSVVSLLLIVLLRLRKRDS